jgi:hypothetical protein
VFSSLVNISSLLSALCTLLCSLFYFSSLSLSVLFSTSLLSLSLRSKDLASPPPPPPARRICTCTCSCASRWPHCCSTRAPTVGGHLLRPGLHRRGGRRRGKRRTHARAKGRRRLRTGATYAARSSARARLSPARQPLSLSAAARHSSTR